MVDSDSMGPGLQRVRVRFSNFLLGKLSREFKLRGMLIPGVMKFKWPYFRIAWGHSHTLGTLVVLHVLCMLIWPWPDPMSRSGASKVPKIALFYVYLLHHFGMELKSDGWSWSYGLILQLVGARFL